jgi:hypothetical protein
MRERLIVLRERRQGLIEQARLEREVVGGLLARTDVPGRWLDAGMFIGAFLRRHPIWIAGAAGLLLALKPGRALGWAMKAWSLYRLYRRGLVLWDRVAPFVMAARRSA